MKNTIGIDDFTFSNLQKLLFVTVDVTDEDKAGDSCDGKIAYTQDTDDRAIVNFVGVENVLRDENKDKIGYNPNDTADN